jgi:hypothetical protein
VTEHVDVGIREDVSVDVAGVALYNHQVGISIAVDAVPARVFNYKLLAAARDAYSIRHVASCNQNTHTNTHAYMQKIR